MLSTIKPRIVFQTAKGSPLGRITLAGLLQNHTGIPERPMRTLGNYALVYLLRGRGSFEDASGFRCPLVPGDLLWVLPDIPHWYGPPKGSVWDEFYIVFSGPVFDVWRAKGLLNAANPVRHLEPLKYWLRRMEEVILNETDSLQQVCSLQHLLAELLEASDSSHEPDWLAQARLLLGTECACPHLTARNVGMVYDTFRKRFTSATGISPAQYRMMKLIDKACALMVSGELSNKEIAEQLNFADPFHFSRKFKQVVGLTTQQFRQKMPPAKSTLLTGKKYAEP